MPDSSNKCFSAIMSRLLCSGGLPTHPSEQLIESNIVKLESKRSEAAEESVKPGVVARLMGLESFPPAPPKERTLGDFFRSRSVNSIDFLSHFDPVKQYGSRRHRRVRTSVSFREGLVSDEFTNVVLLFEEEMQGKMEEEKRRRNHGKKVDAKCMEIQERRKSVCRKKEGKSGFEKEDNLQGKIRANMKERRPVMKVVKCEEKMVGLKKKNTKILAHKLNCDFKKIHPQGTAPEVARRAISRTKNQTASTERESSCSNAAFSDNVVVNVIVEGKNERKTKIEERFCNNKMVEEICILSEEDVRENWVYGMGLKFDDFEEICQLFGQEILQVLLKQFVDDLVLNFDQ